MTDDFIYDDPDPESPSDPENTASDTPDEAVRKLKKKEAPADKPESAGSEPDSEPAPEEKPRKVYGPGIMLDDDLQPITDKAPRNMKRHPVLRGFILTSVTLVLLICVAAYIFHRIYDETPGLDIPENTISNIVTPVQSMFSGLTETIFGYFRSMKLRANLEEAYNDLRAENEQLVYKAMLAEELQQTLSQYEGLLDEIKANQEMEPIVCTIIGKSDSNYFSTFTIGKGLNDGIKNYMAVTISGALVGYTENVQERSATVRTIIDSEASIAALIQSSRDQGIVSGTLGVDGTPMCRMYYLPDENLPRPGDVVVTSGVGMSFPKGIPIGVVRESTRGMEANKQYIVLEPKVDFQHLEYVIVLRYQPPALAVEGRENNRTVVDLVPVVSARPSPEVPMYASSLFGDKETPDPDATASPTPTVPPTPEPTVTPTPSPEPTITPVPTPYEPPLEYQVVLPKDEPTPTVTPTMEPTATPYYTPDPDEMTFEED